jgi:hypothetical protein
MPAQLNKLQRLPDALNNAGYQQHYDQIVDTLNALAGHMGPIPLKNHIDMGGNSVLNLGESTDPTAAIPAATAEGKYSAAALAPQISPAGKQAMSGYRILGSGSQREPTSSFLKDLMSSVPNANGILPTLQPVGGGVQVTIPAEKITFADQSSLLLQGRVDIIALPSSFSITSISAVSNLVTVTTSPATGLVAGQLMTVDGVTPGGFNGAFFVSASSGGGATLKYIAPVGPLAGTGGSVEISNVYYYTASKRSTQLQLVGPFNGDTAQNRLTVNFDSQQIVAVVTLTASGGQVSSSGGGGTPIVGSPTAGSFF